MKFENKIYHFEQVDHEKLSILGFFQPAPGINGFIRTNGSELSAGFLTKSCLNIITVNPALTRFNSSIGKEHQGVDINFELPPDELFSIGTYQKPVDYMSNIECVMLPETNSFVHPIGHSMEYIFANIKSCLCFRIPLQIACPA